MIGLLAGLVLFAAAESDAFDAEAAWTEFEGLVREYYAYTDRPGAAAFEAQLARSKALALETDSDGAFRRLIHQTALTFSDPHFIIGPFDDQDYAIIYTASDLAISLEGGLYRVADVRQGSAAAGAGIRPGWQVLKADGERIATSATQPYGDILSEPNAQQLAYGATLVANGRRGQPRTLTFKDSRGRKREISLPSPSDFAREVSGLPALTVARVGESGQFGHVRFNNSLGQDQVIAEFDGALAELADTQGLIIDLRNTPSGGNTDVARAVIGHFITGPRAYQRHTMPVVERTTSVPRLWVEYAAPRAPHYGKPVVVLHSRWTGSMGEGLVIGLDAAADAHTIGSDMGDLLGALWNFDLEKAKARIDMAGEALFHVDGTPREDYIADHPLAAADTAPNGDDPAMNAALSYLANP